MSYCCCLTDAQKFVRLPWFDRDYESSDHSWSGVKRWMVVQNAPSMQTVNRWVYVKFFKYSKVSCRANMLNVSVLMSENEKCWYAVFHDLNNFVQWKSFFYPHLQEIYLFQPVNQVSISILSSIDYSVIETKNGEKSITRLMVFFLTKLLIQETNSISRYYLQAWQ